MTEPQGTQGTEKTAKQPPKLTNQLCGWHECRKIFKGTNRAKYCSNKCRQAAFRFKNGVTPDDTTVSA